MEITKYELVRETREFNSREIKEIAPGCVCNQTGDRFDEVLKYFDTKTEALEELKNFQSNISFVQGFSKSWYEVEEFYVRVGVYEFDPDEPDTWEYNWVDGGDICEFSEMRIRIVDERLEVLATIDNMAEALKLQDEYISNDIDADIMFN